MLSLCMIVKNEESNLEKCLKEVHSYVDEIVIVDTGSNDQTMEIARRYTQNLFSYKWTNDFSEARNYSISKATYNWILVLDADEFITQFDNDRIRRFIEDTKNQNIVGRIQRINNLNQNSTITRQFEYVNRLFNKQYFHYVGTIHEQIVTKDGQVYSTHELEITADHIGYTTASIAQSGKLDRNLSMLTQALKDSPNDPYLNYQIAKTYFMLKNFKDAIIHFQYALSSNVDFNLEYVTDLIETYGYALINIGDYSNALTIIPYEKYYQTIPDFCFLTGLIYMNNAMFDLAIEQFETCTFMHGGRTEGITSWLPLYNIGVMLEVLGYKDKALTYYRQCSHYKPAVERLKLLEK